MLSDILFLRAVSSTFSPFFWKKSPYRVGRHVENSLRISNMASRGKTHTLGRHVERLKIVFMAVCGMSFNTRWAPCRECKPKKGVNLGKVKFKSFLSLIARLRLYSGPSVRKSIT